jgi:hypothetical protein
MPLPPTGSLVALVGGTYNGHFAIVTSYTDVSARLCLEPELVHAWARSTQNLNVVVRHRSIRPANPSEHRRSIGIKNSSTIKVDVFKDVGKEKQVQREVPVESDIELLARLVALRIVDDPDPNPITRRKFLAELDRALDQSTI